MVLVQVLAWVGRSMSWEKWLALGDVLLAAVVLMGLVLALALVVGPVVGPVRALGQGVEQALVVALDLVQALALGQVLVLVLVLAVGLGLVQELGQGLAQDKTAPASVHSPGMGSPGQRHQTVVNQ